MGMHLNQNKNFTEKQGKIVFILYKFDVLLLGALPNLSEDCIICLKFNEIGCNIVIKEKYENLYIT